MNHHIQNDDRDPLSTIIIIVCILFVAFMLWQLAIRPASAAPDEQVTCYEYNVMVKHPRCNVLGWCSAYVTVHVNGTSTITRRVTGWRLQPRQWVKVEVCR